MNIFTQFLLRKAYRYIEKKYGASFMKFKNYFQLRQTFTTKEIDRADWNHSILKSKWPKNQDNMDVRILYNLR